jgi:protein TonB
MRLSIHYFVVASALAHAALVAVWAGAPSQRLIIPATPASAPSLHIALQQAHKVVKRTHARHTQQHPPQPKRHRLTAPTRLARTAVKPLARPALHSSKPTDAAPTHQTALRRGEIRARVLSRIRTDLQQYFVYPLLAQRRGWQGRVLLGFSVAADGMIHNIHVASGSGYPILDSSAVTALSHVHHLYATRGWLPGKPLELQLPVIFQLQGG